MQGACTRCKGMCMVQGEKACTWLDITLRAPVLGLREDSVSQVTPRSSRTGLIGLSKLLSIISCCPAGTLLPPLPQLCTNGTSQSGPACCCFGRKPVLLHMPARAPTENSEGRRALQNNRQRKPQCERDNSGGHGSENAWRWFASRIGKNSLKCEP